MITTLLRLLTAECGCRRDWQAGRRTTFRVSCLYNGRVEQPRVEGNRDEPDEPDEPERKSVRESKVDHRQLKPNRRLGTPRPSSQPSSRPSTAINSNALGPNRKQGAGVDASSHEGAPGTVSGAASGAASVAASGAAWSEQCIVPRPWFEQRWGREAMSNTRHVCCDHTQLRSSYDLSSLQVKAIDCR